MLLFWDNFIFLVNADSYYLSFLYLIDSSTINFSHFHVFLRSLSFSFSILNLISKIDLINDYSLDNLLIIQWMFPLVSLLQQINSLRYLFEAYYLFIISYIYWILLLDYNNLSFTADYYFLDDFAFSYLSLSLSLSLYFYFSFWIERLKTSYLDAYSLF